MAEVECPLIRILVLDDHAVVRHGIISMIADEKDMQVVAEAGNAEDALPLYLQHRPGVAIVDLRLPGMSGAAFIAAAKKAHPEGNFVVLTTWDSDEDIYQAFTAGANAYVLKDSFSSEIISTIRKVNQGFRIMPADIASRLDERASAGSLSPREREVLALVAKGEPNKVIAAQLAISEGTVKTYMLRIFEKLGVDDRTAAVTAAITRGIIRM